LTLQIRTATYHVLLDTYMVCSLATTNTSGLNWSFLRSRISHILLSEGDSERDTCIHNIELRTVQYVLICNTHTHTHTHIHKHTHIYTSSHRIGDLFRMNICRLYINYQLDALIIIYS